LTSNHYRSVHALTLTECYFLLLPHSQEHLARAKDYAEAHRMKLKSDALEAWELERWRTKRQGEMLQREQKVRPRS
jgi:hypothetical protein